MGLARRVVGAAVLIGAYRSGHISTRFPREYMVLALSMP